MVRFTEEQAERYARHIVLPQVGGRGQERLRNASVLVVGAGGLGSPVIYYLAAAGVGRLTVLDDERVDRSNLQRQILFRDAEVGRSKAELAQHRVAELNPEVLCRGVQERLTPTNGAAWVGDHDLVIDGTDDPATKFLLNDLCVDRQVPLVYGGVLRMEGQVTCVVPGSGPCLRCLFADADSFGADPQESCSQSGILGPVAGWIGTVQATEALKILLRIGEPLVGRMLTFDGQAGRIRTVRFERRAGCSGCDRGEQNG